MEEWQEIDDQAGFIGAMFGVHLKQHGGKPDPSCSFCKNFILSENIDTEFPLTSYKFIILDVSENE